MTKKFIAMMMVMVMVFSFGSVSVNAAKGDVNRVRVCANTDECDRKTEGYMVYTYMPMFRIFSEEDEEKEVDTRAFMIEYARRNDLRDVTVDNVCKGIVRAHDRRDNSMVFYFNYIGKDGSRKYVAMSGGDIYKIAQDMMA